MARICGTCNRPIHKGRLCDMAELTDGRTVHVERIDQMNGDVRAQIERGEVKVKNRWIKKKPEPKTKVRRS